MNEELVNHNSRFNDLKTKHDNASVDLSRVEDNLREADRTNKDLNAR